jgi:hypothetical protein
MLGSVSSVLGNEDLVNFLIHESDLPELNNICRRLQSKSAVGQCDQSPGSHFFLIDQGELRSPDIAGFDS